MPLDGPRSKLERSKTHLRDLEAAIQRFFESNPYEVVVEDNPHSGQREYRVARADPLPSCLSLIAGDVIHNARSVLDHVIWRLVKANGGEPQERRTAFPIWKSKSAYKAGRPGDAKGISEEALDLLYALKPYKGGNDALWRLHQLDIVDKHRLLLTVAAANRNIALNVGAIMRKTFANTPGNEWVQDTPDMHVALNPGHRTRIATGALLFGVPLGNETYDDVKFAIEVALHEPEIVESEPLIPALDQLVSFVEHVLGLFEPLLTRPS